MPELNFVSTSKIFGDGEFTGLTNNVGFEISDEGLVVIPKVVLISFSLI